MIQETYVTFEQAKALKELGFPQDNTLKMYNINGKVCSFWKGSEEFIKNNLIACTTQSLVQKWLREEKGSYIEITRWDQNEDPEEHGFYWEILDSPSYKKILAHCTESLYKEPEQALSAGINKCIELLKNIN